MMTAMLGGLCRYRRHNTALIMYLIMYLPRPGGQMDTGLYVLKFNYDDISI